MRSQDPDLDPDDKIEYASHYDPPFSTGRYCFIVSSERDISS